ncbi:hypothetical protein AC331_19595 [Salmonella enterica subsp. enterica]|uniref:hypothetical protein n=1 Tax=Salmonella enterica TaxID=28901 RepID=UPI00076B9A53|nr:hypothetical protein [Salmonella enterica]EAW1595195.1 hypothetical protein [Salmonella enterica subsp. enterica]EBW5403410.1 hypothetical protein [Salmonella enterica subsp. enterica serovar Southampton]EDR9147859.1 hypothetical protein [Salmonella enterica subsp. enterica serovar Agbeni]EEP8537278.1 hypothetical protein [Salmonella enterica subsp. enterica serovar Zega]EAW1604533.1 hypothetical protein [Salmonella enterica subsp. enterica]
MSFSQYLDDDRKEFIDITMSIISNVADNIFSYDKEIGSFYKNIINTSSRGAVKSILQKMQKDKQPRDNENFENETLCKLFFILEAHGYSSLADDLAFAMNRRFVKERAQDVIYKEIAAGAAYMDRKKAASGSRHNQKEEIIDVIRETWKTYPWGSKNRMIQKLSERYRVVEKTLKNWMKEEKLAPLEVVISKNYPLVIPLKWQKKEVG